MHARRGVVIPECLQLACQIERIPEQYLVEILAPDRADQPLDERMRYRDIGNGFDFLDFEYPQAWRANGETEIEDRSRC